MNRRERAATRINAAARGHLVREDVYCQEYFGDNHWSVNIPDKTRNRNYDRGWLRYALETIPVGPPVDGADNIWKRNGMRAPDVFDLNSPSLRLIFRGMVTQARYARTNEQMRKHMLRYKYYQHPAWRGSRDTESLWPWYLDPSRYIQIVMNLIGVGVRGTFGSLPRIDE